MHHSQLKIKYPDCPFVWDYEDMRQLFSPEIKRADKKTLLQGINDHIVDCNDKNEKNDENDSEYHKILDFLVKLTDEEKINGMYENIDYVSITQKIPKLKKNMWINFHTSVYRDDNDNHLSQEHSAEIAWCLLPIHGSIEARETNYSIVDQQDQEPNPDPDPDPKNDSISRSLDPQEYEKIDCKYGVIEANIKNIRVAKRNFIKRSDDTQCIQKESESEALKQKNPEIIPIPIPKFKQIDLNNNTRASGSLIRERLNNPYKMSRMRNNPELIKQHNRVDLSLRNVSQKITEIAITRELEKEKNQHIVTRDNFDYIHDQVIIKKVNQILRFGPVQTGKIKFNFTKNQENATFVSVLRYKKYLHITFHKIILI